MARGHTITITTSNLHVEVAVHGQTVAVSDCPVVLDETGFPSRYYLRREDVHTDLLRPTSFQTTCPFKGKASYWSLELDGQVLDGVAWCYETPIAGAEAIAGLLCFFPERVQMTVGTST